jgi:hypothetical protein
MREQCTARSGVVLSCVLSLGSAACDDAGSNLTAASGGTTSVVGTAGGGVAGAQVAGGGTGGAAPSVGGSPPGTALSWTATGFVAKDSNPFGLEGPFYFYNDCDPPSGLACTTPDPLLVGPDGKLGFAVDATRACIKGTAVQVQNQMFSAQWGAGLALDLASPGGMPGVPAVKGTKDLAAAKITGFSVDLTGTAPAKVRINLTMPGVADSNFVEAMVPGTHTFSLSEAKQGIWVKEKTPLDPTRVEAIQFQVATVATSATPFDFCVSGLRVITSSEAP